jgi:Protein of unknown function (DUF3108)
VRALFLLLSLMLAPPAAAERYALTYEGAALGFIPLGDMSVDADVADDSYEVTASLRSRGLLDWFERTALRASASGLIVGESVRWRRYHLDHHYSRKHRVTHLEVGENGAPVARIEPNYRLWGEPPVNDAQRRRSRDPLSTLVAMGLDVGLTRRCAGAYPTFDGRFHYLLELAGGEIDEFRGGGYRGEVLKCALAYIAIAGFEPRDAGRRRIPHGEVWFALAPGAAFAPPVRISTPLSAGGAVVRLTSWRRAEVTIDYGAP